MLEQRNHHGINLSSVGLGTWAIGGPYWTLDEPTGWGGEFDDDDSLKGLLTAIDNGIFHIDTADVYGYGRSERIVGAALGAVSKSCTVTTKVGFTGTSAPSVYSPENIRFQIEQSLRNLNRDIIDIYYVHHCDFGENDVFLQPAVEEIQNLKKEGLIKSIGLSGYSETDLIRVSTALRPDFIQSWASIEHREFIHENSPLAMHMSENDIKFIAMMPFGQGRILGKYTPNTIPSFQHGDNRQGNPEFEEESLADFLPRLLKLKERFGERPRDLIVPALGYILKHSSVISVIPGYRNSQQVQELVEAICCKFTDDDKAFIDEVFPFEEMKSHPWAE